MMSTWFGSRASRGSRLPQTTPPLSQPHQLAKTEIATLPTDSSVLKHSQSISTLEPPAAFSPSSSRSGALLSDVHVNINDPSAYGAGSLSPIPVDVRAREDPAEAFTSLDLDDTYPAVDLKKDKGKGREIEGPGRPLFTPQDAVLTEVFGFPLPANPEATTTTLSDSDPMPHSSVATGGSAPLAPLPLYDPFSGARIGDHTSPATSTATANTTSTTGVEQPGQQQNKSHCLPMTGDSDLWSHLSRVLELQAEVAGMHAEMEGVGVAGSSAGGHGGVRLGPNSGTSDTRPPGVNAGIKRRMKGATMPVGDDDEPPQQVRSADGAVTDSSSEDEDKDDAKGFAKRRRDEDFAKLADQFTERKIAIARIMGKLDDLSGALKAFHALPTPHMDLGLTTTSRTDTISSVTSGATNTSISSPPPHHTRFFQPAIITTDVVQPTMSSVSSKPSQAAQSHGKLIFDAQHVDSPVEMHATQSSFR